MKNTFYSSLIFILSIVFTVELFGMQQKTRKISKTDSYMLFAEAERLGRKASTKSKSNTEPIHTGCSSLKKAFGKHDFLLKSNEPNPYIISHTLNIKSLTIYREKGMSQYTDDIFTDMYSDGAIPMYVNKYNLDKNYFTDFDTKYQNGMIRRIGEWTYGERLGDGVIKLVAFFYDPAVLQAKVKGAKNIGFEIF